MYKVIQNPIFVFSGIVEYIVINDETKEIQSAWKTAEQALEVSKDLNNSKIVILNSRRKALEQRK